ncbi:creatininase family protein [Halobacillus campisalis]|uniref:Creatininase family protein n=1 Tax=Halobacillus campisalis TaxID=435909 RepID=A0ABW2JZJ3_9BACI|nr:creatininase family protein [Halobacillus campisalis]
MNTNKHAIHHMTWKEAQKVYKKDPVVIVPLGSMEEHGPHSITGDYLAATAIAKRVAEQSDAVYIPTIPFGNSEYFRGYPGTISLSQETVISILEDIFRSLIEHGITRILVFNGHAGNAPAVEQVARKVRREDQTMIASVNLWQAVQPGKKKELYGERDPSGHGGEPLTSIMHYLYPDDMRMDLLGDWEEKEQWNDFTIKNMKEVQVGESSANLYFNIEEVSPEGILGNPTQSSAEKGEKIVDHITQMGVTLVEKLNDSNMKL